MISTLMARSEARRSVAASVWNGAIPASRRRHCSTEPDYQPVPSGPIHGPASQKVRDHTDSVDKVRMNRLRKFARRQLDMLLGIPAKLNSIPEGRRTPF